MKHVRKIAIILIAAVMAVAVAISVCVIFSVKNVNVTYIGEQTAVTERVAKIKNNVLNKIRGTVISLVKESDIIESVGDEYDGKFVAVYSCEKVYPCTVNLVVKERIETYAVADAGGYKVYDADGQYLKNSVSLLNSNDNSPNVVLSGADSSENIDMLVKAGRVFSLNFSSLRATVSEIKFEKAQSSFAKDTVTFVLRSGLSVEVLGYDYLAEKITRAAEAYSSLTGEEKLGGKIYCVTVADESGTQTVRATYRKAD